MGKYIEITNSKIRKFIERLSIKITERQIVYNVFIKPYTEYGILALEEAPKTRLNKTSRNLKKAVRVMMFKNKYESTKPLFEYLSIVSLNLSIKLQQGKFMKQLSFDLQPESITKHFPLRFP